MTRTITHSAIINMAKIIADAESKGYIVISGRPTIVATTYAFYSIKKDELFDEIEDCYFKAYINNNGVVIYKPLDADAYHGVEE